METHSLQSQVPLFRGLDGLQLLRIASEASLERIPSGGTYYRGLIPPRPAVYLVSGLVGVRNASAAGRRFGPHLFSSGEWLLLNYTVAGDPEPWGLEVYRDAVLVHLPYASLLALAQVNTQFAINLMHALATESQKLYDETENLLHSDIERRCTYLLHYLSRRFFHSPQFKLPFTQAQIADLLHTSREVVSRSFASLKKQGLIGGDGREIHLKAGE